AVAFDEAPGLAAARYLESLAAQRLTTASPDWAQAFVAGRLGMMVNSSVDIVPVREQARFRFRIAPMPTPAGEPPRLPTAGNALMIFARDPARRAAAWELARFWIGPEAAQILARTSSYAPPNAAALAQLESEVADPDLRVAYQQARNVSPWHS